VSNFGWPSSVGWLNHNASDAPAASYALSNSNVDDVTQLWHAPSADMPQDFVYDNDQELLFPPNLFDPLDFSAPSHLGAASHGVQSSSTQALASQAINIPRPQGGPLSGLDDNFIYSETLNPLGATTAMTPSISTDPSSHHSAIFTNMSASNLSHANTFSNIGGPSSQWSAPADDSSSSYLTNNLLFLPEVELQKELAESRVGKQWKNWENQKIIMFWVGPASPAHYPYIAMGSPRQPKNGDRLMPEWSTVCHMLLSDTRLILSSI
jgi:hypothetical protein